MGSSVEHRDTAKERSSTCKVAQPAAQSNSGCFRSGMHDPEEEQAAVPASREPSAAARAPPRALRKARQRGPSSFVFRMWGGTAGVVSTS